MVRDTVGAPGRRVLLVNMRGVDEGAAAIVEGVLAAGDHIVIVEVLKHRVLVDAVGETDAKVAAERVVVVPNA